MKELPCIFLLFNFRTLKFDVWRHRLGNTSKRFRAYDWFLHPGLQLLILLIDFINWLSRIDFKPFFIQRDWKLVSNSLGWVRNDSEGIWLVRNEFRSQTFTRARVLRRDVLHASVFPRFIAVTRSIFLYKSKCKKNAYFY